MIFLAIARWAKAGDYGALITAAEWLDVNYGKLVRDAFVRNGTAWTPTVAKFVRPFSSYADRFWESWSSNANHVWIAGEHSEGLPDEVLFPTVTKAMELFRQGKYWPMLAGCAALLIFLSIFLPTKKRGAIKDFLKRAKKMGQWQMPIFPRS